jgi:hypothetical protein
MTVMAIIKIVFINKGRPSQTHVLQFEGQYLIYKAPNLQSFLGFESLVDTHPLSDAPSPFTVIATNEKFLKDINKLWL